MPRPFVILLAAAALLSVPGNTQTARSASDTPSGGSAPRQLSKEDVEQQTRDNPLTVIYTGALFGYYRMEPGESPDQPFLTPVHTLLDALKAETQGPTKLLLGMGDNFGPEMGAALQLENRASADCKWELSQVNSGAAQTEPLYSSATQGNVPIPIAVYKDGARAAKSANCDNVARFLLQAGYKAIVPGREDFLYSSTWLAYIAHDLQKLRDAQKRSKSAPGLVMLAANLKLKLKRFEPPKDKAVVFNPEDYQKWNPLLFANCQSPQESQQDGFDCKIDLGTADQDGVGYTTFELDGASGAAATPGKVKVLVVGVIGQRTTDAISPANRRMCFFVSDSKGTAARSVACNRKDLEKLRDKKEAFVEFSVETGEPAGPVLDILREADHDDHIAYRILMAQMPRTEAEELAAKLRSVRAAAKQFDLVISEAQPVHSTPNATLSYEKFGDSWDLTPVVTPDHAYRRERCSNGQTNCQDGYLPWGLFRPDSSVSLVTVKGTRTVQNTPHSQDMETAARDPQHTAVQLLRSALAKVTNSSADPCSGTEPPSCPPAMTKYLLQVMQHVSHADVAVLERRDVFIGYLPPKYDDYHAICDPVPEDRHRNVCELRVALDRVLWKGDYSQRVMMSGKDIQSLLKKSKDLREAESSLNPKDTLDEWLISFGIVSQAEAKDPFAATHSDDCKVFSANDFAGASGKNSFCVNGEALLADHAYAIVTSDHMASDTQVYTAMSGLPDNYREHRTVYLTQEITDFLVEMSHNAGGTFPNRKTDQDGGTMRQGFATSNPVRAASQSGQPRAFNVQREEEEHQDRGIVQIDVAKLVAGYNARLPQSGDQNIADKFQGATDTRASSPSSAELDLEAKVRVLRKVWHRHRLNLAIGSQDAFAYDRSVQGNLGGNAVNASYPLNSSTAGGFLQFGFKIRPTKKKSGAPGIFDGKTMIVIAPFQYQRQIVGSYLFFPFAFSKAQLTVHSPIVDGFSHRFGWRGEATRYRLWDPGTYAEIGWQAVVQNNLLSSVTLSTPGTPVVTCPPPDRSVTINTCFRNAGYVVGPTTTASQTLTTLHSQGLYWDIHWQKGLVPLADKNGITLSFDSTGDWFVSKAGLPSQTRYDIPLKFALTLPIFRNFGIGPAYSPFFYSNQVNHKSLVVQNFALSARWYFVRDAAVGLRRQVVFNGPSSADETKTARIK